MTKKISASLKQSVHVHLGMIPKNHISGDSGDGPGQGRKDCGSAGGRGAALWLHRDWLRSQGVEPGGADQRYSKMPGCIDGSKTWVNHIGFYILCFFFKLTMWGLNRIFSFPHSERLQQRISSCRSRDSAPTRRKLLPCKAACSGSWCSLWYICLELSGGISKMPLVNISGGLTGWPNQQWVRHLPNATIG